MWVDGSHLAWSQSEVRANVIHVPLSDIDSVKAAWQLDSESSAALDQAVSQLSPAALGAVLEPPPTQTLHLYAGSHMEAVAGTCTLANIITDTLSVPVEDKD